MISLWMRYCMISIQIIHKQMVFMIWTFLPVGVPIFVCLNTWHGSRYFVFDNISCTLLILHLTYI